MRTSVSQSVSNSSPSCCSHRYRTSGSAVLSCARFQSTLRSQRNRANQGRRVQGWSAVIGGKGRGGHVWPTEARHWSAGLPAVPHADWPRWQRAAPPLNCFRCSHTFCSRSALQCLGHACPLCNGETKDPPPLSCNSLQTPVLGNKNDAGNR